jgi:hypothetical protein
MSRKQESESQLSVRVLPGINYTNVGVIAITLQHWARLRARGPEYHQMGGLTVKVGAGALTRITTGP